MQAHIAHAAEKEKVITQLEKMSGIAWCEAPAGEFLMGSGPSRDPDAQENEQPQHKVSLPTYYIARHAVTVAQFRAFMQASGFQPGGHDYPKAADDYPLVWVNWYEAQAYGDWLTDALRGAKDLSADLARLLQAGWRVRLPTEAEREKAARGSDGRIYPWGDEWEEGRANIYEVGIDGPSAVGRFSPGGDSPYGAADMVGNVWEWCQSLYRPYPYRADDGREDLHVEGTRVLRSGAWPNGREDARCAYRADLLPGNCGGSIGFRVVFAPRIGTIEGGKEYAEVPFAGCR